MSYPLATNSPTTSKSLHFSDLLSSAGLEALNARIAANADQWLTDNAPKTKRQRKPKGMSGPKPKAIDNPFYRFYGCLTDEGRYPDYAIDIIEGVVRLDWHDRPIGAGGKSMPLSKRHIAIIIECLPTITNEAVEDLLQLEERHARRYFRAIKLIIPRMVGNRPLFLRNEMEGIEPEPKPIKWENLDDLQKPTAAELAKLHYDLRTFTEYATAEEYETEEAGKPNNVITFPVRNQHPKKAEVMGMLVQGVSQSEIERLTGVPRKTVRRWQTETPALAA
ncbi:helix-turn-helix domain-containing protein [Pseudomonas sp. SH10-3B]|uniref:helix-turn-helix domain-containing protein n=1 Tax=Pseudomonas sp. SH10-3B TaxID=2816049 RepID=UPI001CA770AE|nr:helix-turn-helix domain-containing protein [Pseudomonas sp. SH10-3B]MBY8947155.1 helix-turn-helix domain-containing protein [Pseudomonas sp. SH10-3B]